MKAENSTRIQFDSLSSNEAYARGVTAAFLSSTCALLELAEPALLTDMMSRSLMVEGSTKGLSSLFTSSSSSWALGVT